MLGKAKCKILKEIRQKIADENDIPYVTRECTYQGDCSGTCPRCESELRYLEQELEARKKLGKTVAVTALCTGISFGTVACSIPGQEHGGDYSGDVTVAPDDDYAGGLMADPGDDYELAGDTQYIPELAGEAEDWSDCESNSTEGEIQKTSDGAFDNLHTFASTVNGDEVCRIARYCPMFMPDKDIKLCALTTHHLNEGNGTVPGYIRIYDVTYGEDELLGTWKATSRDEEGAQNVYWDIFPDITLQEGHIYHIVDSAPETLCSNSESEEIGAVELFTDEETTVEGEFTPCYR